MQCCIEGLINHEGWLLSSWDDVNLKPGKADTRNSGRQIPRAPEGRSPHWRKADTREQ